MFIRQTRTANKITGEGYFTFRLVRGERIAGKVRQRTLLNLGRNFAIKQDHWPLLCSRIEQLLAPQESLLELACPDMVERAAQRYVGQLIARAPAVTVDAATVDTATDTTTVATAAQSTAGQAPPQSHSPDIRTVDIDSLQTSQPRSVGLEHVALHAVTQLGLLDKLADLGINGVMRAAMLGNLVARMAHPASERATLGWLQAHSALGELIDVDFASMSHMALYRASDMLMSHREAIEAHVFGTVQTLFSLETTVTLYDLTNTYFEGAALANPKAKHGRSKEKRSDSPLLTLGLVLDGSGFVRRSRTFTGSVAECKTLEEMLAGLDAPPGALVVMDAGIATQANLVWLVAQGYRYLVVRRGGARQFDSAQDQTQSTSVQTAGGETVQLQRTLNEDGSEVLLYCHSAGREAKETAMVTRFGERYEAGLQKIASGLTTLRGEKRLAKLQERIGRLKEKSRGASQHYTLTLSTDDSGKTVTALTWVKALVTETMATHPGVYCLRSNELSWDAQRLWRTYTMLTDLESVFRSLKSELGLRPVFHSSENRADGHLFITVLAYQCVQVFGVKLKAAGIDDSWTSLRASLSVQRRSTTSLRCTDGQTVHVRKSTQPEPAALRIYQALGVNSMPGGTRKRVN